MNTQKTYFIVHRFNHSRVEYVTSSFHDARRELKKLNAKQRRYKIVDIDQLKQRSLADFLPAIIISFGILVLYLVSLLLITH